MKKKYLALALMSLCLLIGVLGNFGEKETVFAADTPDIVVVLDAGHDEVHGGATAFGYQEHKLVYKMAQYCKEELEEYKGVKVYITRDSNECPSGKRGSVDCNLWRVNYAKEAGADVLVSFHLNATERGNASGVSIYYPNANYRPGIGKQGKALANSLLEELIGIGLSQFQEGCMIRNSEDGSRYPDGSLADYLAILKAAKLKDFPAVLIEHAFIDNKNDADQFLSSDEKLKKIGIADATGIANYLGLSKDAQVKEAEDGNWYYYNGEEIDTAYTGIAPGENGWMYVENGKVNFSGEKLALYDGTWWYIKDGFVDTTYDGVASNSAGTWYIEDGKVDFSKNGLYQRGDKWYYFKGGAIDYGFTGLTNSNVGWWYIENGTITYQYTGLVYYNNAWWYVENSHLNFAYDGVADNHAGTWYIENSQVDFSKNGLLQRGNKWYYFKGGAVDYGFTGLTNSNVGWWYIENGTITYQYTGLVYYNNAWWYIENSHLTFAYDGVADNHAGTWYIENSQVDFSKNGLLQRGNNWYYFKGGAVDYGFTGLTNSNVGWWYIENGTITFQYNGLVYYNNAWWYIENSHLTFAYDGVADNHAGTWYLENSQVDFSKNGLLQRGDKWYYFKGGAVDFGFSGLTNSYVGWWYIENGTITFQYNGLVYYNNAWWYIENSHLTFAYDGLADNHAGTWYVENSQVNFGYSGMYEFNGEIYVVTNGQAIPAVDPDCNLPIYDTYYKYEYAYRHGGDVSDFTEKEKAFYKGLSACLDSAYQYGTAFEQEKAVHDYIVLNCAYDMEVVYTGVASDADVYQPEGVFVNKVAVCDGYSKAFQLCMDILGIECIRVTGTANGGAHAWNAVKLDNEWYMVDVTWDDPVPDTPGEVIYNYFNVTDAKLKRDHTYTCSIEANGTKYFYYGMQENYFTNTEDYYAYLNYMFSIAKPGETIKLIVELNTPWTEELIHQYMDSSKIVSSNYAAYVSYTTYTAVFEWTVQ